MRRGLGETGVVFVKEVECRLPGPLCARLVAVSAKVVHVTREPQLGGHATPISTHPVCHSPGFRAATLKLRCGVWEKKSSVVQLDGGGLAGEDRKRLPIPEVMMPGFMPRNGESNETIPRSW